MNKSALFWSLLSPTSQSVLLEVDYNEAFEKNANITKKKSTNQIKLMFTKVLGEDRGSHFIRNKASALQVLLKYFFHNVLPLMDLPYSPLSHKPSQLPTIFFHHLSHCSELGKAIQILLSKISQVRSSPLNTVLGLLISTPTT